MKVLITGASGLLGSHLVNECLGRGYTTTCGARRTGSRTFLSEKIADNSVEVVDLDLSDISSFPDMTGFDVVINSAAFASPFEKDFELMKEVNIEGTKNIYNLAKDQGVKQFVQISSIACFGSSSYNDEINESCTEYYRESYYGKTKKEADLWLESQSGMPVLTIHPCYMLGQWDSRPSSGAILFAMKMKKFSAYINNYKNFVAASDVARATVDAVSKEVSGKFIIGGVNVKIEEFFLTYKSITGEDISHVQEVFEKELHQTELDEQRGLIKEFCLSYKVNFEKAAEFIDYKPQSTLKEMIEETISYFESKKMIRFKGRKK